MKKIIEELKFSHQGDWNALMQAEKYLKDRGYDFGSMDYPNPIGVTKGDYYSHPLNLPHKWHNMTSNQRRALDGVITGDFRNGPVTLKIYS